MGNTPTAESSTPPSPPPKEAETPDSHVASPADDDMNKVAPYRPAAGAPAAAGVRSSPQQQQQQQQKSSPSSQQQHQAASSTSPAKPVSTASSASESGSPIQLSMASLSLASPASPVVQSSASSASQSQPAPFTPSTPGQPLSSRAVVDLFYDSSLSSTHIPSGEKTEFEIPQRVKVIYDHLRKMPSFTSSFRELNASHLPAQTPAHVLRVLSTCHGPAYLSQLQGIPTLTYGGLRDMEKAFDNDIFVHGTSYAAALTSCLGVVECCRLACHPPPPSAAASSSSSSSSSAAASSPPPRAATATPLTPLPATKASGRALAVVRPPGHHACSDKAMGFCFLNNAAVAAKTAVQAGWARRVFIVDWDVHHGNGTQDLTYDDPNIAYLSLHQYGMGTTKFYPGTGAPNEIGTGSAQGLNINIAWSHGKMGNTEYCAAFSEVVLPLVKAFEPDLIIVSSGFDAVRGDHLGDCDLTPECYHMMTASLLAVVSGTGCGVVVALEGGYNLEVIPLCMEAVAIALCGEDYDVDGTKKAAFDRQSGAYGMVVPSARMRVALSDCTLTKARLLLTKFWDYYEAKDYHRGRTFAKGASSSINRTVKALNSCERWKDLGLREVTEQIEKRVINTRKASSKAVNEDLSLQFGKMGGSWG